MTETKKGTPVVKKDKNHVQELESQVKDIRQQLADQLRCLETRTDVETAILSEIQDYFKRRADIELDYSRNLEKLAKQTTARHKAEKQKREQWPLFSLCSWWQQLIEDTKTEARHRSVTSDLYSHYVVSKLASQSEQLQRISKRCREIGADAHQEILRVLAELHTAMKTYQLCHAASANAETKFRSIETQKQRFEESFPNKVGNRKHRFVEKDFEKKQAKYLDLQLKTLKARNEYLLCIDAANAALHKYFADDLSNLADCMDVGTEQWLASVLSTLLEAQRQLLDASFQHSNATKTWLQDFDARTDKRRFLEAHHATFTLPRKFEFRPFSGDNDDRQMFTANSTMEEELKQRHTQLERRLRELRTENEEVWKTYETAERKLMEIQRLPELKVPNLFNPPPPPPQTPPLQLQATASASNVLTNPMTTSMTALGIIKSDQTTPRNLRNSCREPDTILQKRKLELCEMEEYLLQKFHQYVLTANLIRRLEARHSQIQTALGFSPAVLMSASMASFPNGARNGNEFQSIDAFLDSCHSLTSSFAPIDSGDGGAPYLSSSTLGRLPSLPPKARRKRVGRASDFSASDDFGVNATERRPRLFGGSLEEYVEATGEEIPLVIRSSIRMLKAYGLHHQGIFRVSGSQVEINAFKDAFEKGEDPLADVTDASDVNSVAGVLKLYFRELLEPLFPMFMFDQFVDCTRADGKAEVISKVQDLLKTLPRPVYVVMRYLFGFLNHLSEFSDENMMDPYNLAICFGPTLLPIPESRDQVFFHNHVNELMKNMIVYHEDIFPNDDPLLSGGIMYEKYLVADDLGAVAIGEQNEFEEEGDAAVEEADGYETVKAAEPEKSATLGSGRKLALERAYNEYQPIKFGLFSTDATALSPADSTEPAPDDAQRTLSDDLNLSNHGSLKASPDSPGQALQDDTQQQQQREVWLRRRIESPLFEPEIRLETSSGDVHTPDVKMRKSSERSAGGNSLNRKASPRRGTDRPNSAWSRDGDDDTSSSSSASNLFPREFTPGSLASAGKQMDIGNVALQFRTTSTSSSSNYSELVPNGGGGQKQAPKSSEALAPSYAVARNNSVSSEPSKPASRRECKIGSLKRLSLSSYGVPATSAAATTNNGGPSPSSQLPLGAPQQDLEFIQQTDFAATADGLSPTSLKEIQTELKAVLTSLESFAVQQHKPKAGVKTSGDEKASLSPDDAANGVDRLDLVQNLPAPTSATSSTTPSSPASCIAVGDTTVTSSVLERFVENKDDTIKKATAETASARVADPTASGNAPSKPIVPNKPAQLRSPHSPSPSRLVGRQFSSIDSSSEGYGEEALL